MGQCDLKGLGNVYSASCLYDKL